MELLLHQWGGWLELYRSTDKTEATEIVIIDSQMNYRGKLDTYLNPISSLLLPYLCYTILVSDFTNSIPAQRKGLAVYPEGYTLSPFSISSMHISNSKMHSCVPHDTINQMYAGTENE